MYYSKPRWWVLYTLVPLMVGGWFLVNGSGWAALAKSLADILIILGTFGAMALWMRSNQGGIERAEYEKEVRARAKLHRRARAWRSRPFPSSRPAGSQQDVPLTGFGSARNKPSITYSTEIISSDRARVQRRRVELGINPERNY
jgi:hypothetical protein